MRRPVVDPTSGNDGIACCTDSYRYSLQGSDQCSTDIQLRNHNMVPQFFLGISAVIYQPAQWNIRFRNYIRLLSVTIPISASKRSNKHLI